MTQDQFERLLDAIPHTLSFADVRAKAIFSLMYAAGLIPEEVSKVKYGDFERSVGEITAMAFNGRIVLIDSKVSQILRDYEAAHDLRNSAPVQPDSPYFVNKFGTGISERSVRRSFRISATRAGLLADISLRCLRRGYVLNLPIAAQQSPGYDDRQTAAYGR